jgi:hypothetical protein
MRNFIIYNNCNLYIVVDCLMNVQNFNNFLSHFWKNTSPKNMALFGHEKILLYKIKQKKT